MTNRKSTRMVQAWGRAPRAGALTIQKQQGKRWVSIITLNVKVDQVFEMPIALRQAARFRAVVGAAASPAWTQAAS
jgi:hypothetical protein